MSSDERDEDEDESEEVKIAEVKATRTAPPPTPLHQYRVRVLVLPAYPGPAHRCSLPSVSYRGNSVLVIDTNILLYSFSIFASLVESICWTILVPLAVITEPGGIATNNLPLGEAATAAVEYIGSHMRSHTRSLKVQTSNYLQTLSIRSSPTSHRKGIWMTCSSVLPYGKTTIGLIDRRCWIVVRKPVPVQRMLSLLALTRIVCFSSPPSLNMLMTFLTVRLKARARQLDAANEKDMAAIMKAGE